MALTESEELELLELENANAIATQQKQTATTPSRMDQAKELGASMLGSLGSAINPLAPLAVKVGQYIAKDPRKAVLQGADYLPAAGGIALPVVAGFASGGTSIPASAALSGIGMAGGEGYKQLIRRGMGENPAPPIPNPIPFTKGNIPRIPGLSSEDSNLATQAGIGVAQDLAVQPLRLLPKVGRGIINAITPSDIKSADILERYKNPVGVKTALPRENLGKVLVEQHKNLGEQIKALDQAAKNMLNDSPTISKSKVIEMLKQIKSKTVGSAGKAVSSDAKTSVNIADEAINSIRGMNPIPDVPGKKEIVIGPSKLLETKITPPITGKTLDTISERQLKDLMSQYKNIPWNDPSADAQKQVRNFLDYILKKSNPEYANAMKPVAERTKLQGVIEKKMALKYDPTTGTYATDATAGKWTPRLLEEGKPETSAALKKLDKLTNGNILEKARLTNINEKFTGGKTTGSRMVQLGRHIGGPVGGIAGALMDKAGGKITGGMVDALKFASETIGSPLNTQTASALLKALSRKKEVNK